MNMPPTLKNNLLAIGDIQHILYDNLTQKDIRTLSLVTKDLQTTVRSDAPKFSKFNPSMESLASSGVTSVIFEGCKDDDTSELELRLATGKTQKYKFDANRGWEYLGKPNNAQLLHIIQKEPSMNMSQRNDNIRFYRLSKYFKASHNITKLVKRMQRHIPFARVLQKKHL